MLSRALIVLLIVLNAGVALWWATRPSPAGRQAESRDGIATALPAGVARLQLLREAPQGALARAPAAPPAAAVDMIEPDGATEVATAPRCFSIGPFDDPQALAAARTQLQPQVASLRTRATGTPRSRGWQVLLPPLADRAAAEAMAERIKAAGFDDYFVVPDGDQANGIALGRYGSESSARARETTLRTAGFQVEALPLGEAGARTWLDVRATGAAFDAERARRAAGAARADPLDCTTLR
jgi:cell division septation protein DedD